MTKERIQLDVNGNALNVGDTVAVALTGYNRLYTGRIEKFNEKTIQVAVPRNAGYRVVNRYPEEVSKVIRKQDVVLDADRFNDLLDDSHKLNALENGGVDNWEWYSESLAPYWAAKEESGE